jgi:hypothetical protein
VEDGNSYSTERYDRRRCWWMDHHDQFAAALL